MNLIYNDTMIKTLTLVLGMILIVSLPTAFADIVEEKFDPFFHDKIKGLIGGEISGASADEDGLYNVIMVVNGGTDNEIQENKDALVKLLEDIGAKNIKPAVVLAFVTADIPIQEIPSITGLAQIMQIGDGELPVELAVDKSKETIKATSQDIRQIHNTDLTGDGVRVGVLDTGINSIHLNDKVIKRTYCTGDDCNIENGYFTGTLSYNVGLLNSTSITHGSRVASIIAADGMTRNNGIAPGVDLLDIMIAYTPGPNMAIINVMSHLHALDWAIVNNVDVVSSSIAKLFGCSPRQSTNDIIYERAVTRGLIIIQATGNYGNSYYQSLLSPACARNVISVGGIDDRTQSSTNMYDGSSRGPTHDALPILKPEIVAPAIHIQLLTSTTSEKFATYVGGTSLSTPMVSAVSALMLEADSTLTPTEVKNLLLLGANWTGPIPCTSSQYEQNKPNDNCSFARQPSDNSRDGIDILNNVGFGILDAQKSINYTINSDTYMISSYLQDGVIPARNYTITIPDTNQPVKIILNWLVKPPAANFINPVPANINFDVICGDKTYTARSAHQTNEFVVFNPTSAGECTVAVTGAKITTFGRTTQHFTLSSSVPISVDTTSRNNVNGVGSVSLFDITTRSVGKASIDTSGKYTYSPANTAQKGHIYIPPSTTISSNLFVAGDVGKTCLRGTVLSTEYVSNVNAEFLTLPDGITSGVAYGFGYTNYGDDITNPKNCVIRHPAMTTSFDVDNTLQVVLYDQASKEGYWYLRINNVDTAQDIPECNSTNFNSITKSLKGNTKMCYADVNNDLVIYTKILQWYGAKDKTVEPAQPDPVPVDPPKVDEPDTPEPVTPIPPVTSPVQDSDIISITVPESMEFDTSDSTLDLNTYTSNKIRIDTYDPNLGTRYFINDQADITIFRNTEITGKTFNYGTDQYCYSGDLRVGTIPGITLPITNVSNVLYIQFRDHSPDRCDQSPDIDLTGNLDLDTNVYVRFVNSAGLNPFYTNGTHITPIPKCNTTNFDNTTNTLNNINACYGKNNNDMIIVSKVLSIFGVTIQDITNQPEPVQPDPIIIPGNIISYTDYNNIVNGTTPQPYTLSNIKNIFDIMPICNIIHNFDHTISMNQDAIIIQYTVNNNKASDSLKSILVLNTKSESNVLSVNLVQTNQNSTHTIYTSTIPNNILNNVDSIKSYISDTSNIISKTGIFSNSSTGSPLYYHDGISESSQKIFMNLPNTDNTVQFVNGANTGINENVHVPNGNTVSLSDDVLCRYATIKPSNIADLSNIKPSTISNTTSGLLFELKFKNNKLPDQLNWIATNSTDTSTSSTSDTITRNYNLTIPISANGNYDITIYGTVQDKKILGIHNKSYTFNAVIPDPVVIPDPPQVPDLPTRPVQPVQPTNDTDSDVLSITIPESMEFDTSQSTIDLNTYATNKIRIDTYSADMGTEYYTNNVASITLFRDTEITSKEFTYQPDQYCYVGNLLVGQESTISIQHTNTLQLPFTRSSISDRCDQAPTINLDGKLNLDTNVYVRFGNSIDQTPFYHYGTSTIQIPKCSNMNFDSTTNTLKNIEICYGKNNNDIIIVSKVLAVFGITVQDIPEPKQPVVVPIPDPPTPVAPDPVSPVKPNPVTVDPTIQQNAYQYQDYNNKIANTTLNVQKDSKILYLSMPKCEKTRVGLVDDDRIISMTPDKDLVFTITTTRDFTNGKILVIIRDITGVFKQISIEPDMIENNKYKIIIPNDILDYTSEHFNIHAYFYKPSSTIFAAKIYSTDPSGSPLYHQHMNGTSPITIRLPDAVNRIFELGTIDKLDGNVYVPQNKSKNKLITISQDTLCQVGMSIPHQIAKVFNMNITTSNTTDGLEFTYKYSDNRYTYPSGHVAKEQKPETLNYIITGTDGNEITGKTEGKIKKGKSFSFTVPINDPGNYDITMYGSMLNGKLMGTFSDSITFEPISIIPPEDDNDNAQRDNNNDNDNSNNNNDNDNDNSNKQQVEPIQNNTVIPDPVDEPTNDPETNSPTLETPTIQITIPEFMELDITDMTIDLYVYTSNVRIDTYYADIGTKYHITDKSADIIMFRDTNIIKQYTPTKEDYYCYVGDLLVGQDNTISKSHSTALQLSFRNADDPTRCDESPDINLAGKLVLDKEIFVRFANTDNVPFYYDGTVHNIPKCITSNYDNTTNTLKSGEICYGVSGSDTVLVSKILAVFGI